MGVATPAILYLPYQAQHWSKCAPERLKGCKPPTLNTLGLSKGSYMSSNEVISTPALLVCPCFSIIKISKEEGSSPSRYIIDGELWGWDEIDLSAGQVSFCLLVFFSLVLLLFNCILLFTFIILTRFSLTNFILFISIFTLYFLHTFTYIGNVYAIKRHTFRIQVIFSNVTIIAYVLVNKAEQFRTSCALVYYFLNRFKCLFWCCARAFIYLLSDVFATLINIKKTVFYIQSFFDLLIRCNPIIFPDVHFTIVYAYFIGIFRFWCNSRLNHFVDVFLVDDIILNCFIT